MIKKQYKHKYRAQNIHAHNIADVFILVRAKNTSSVRIYRAEAAPEPALGGAGVEGPCVIMLSKVCGGLTLYVCVKVKLNVSLLNFTFVDKQRSHVMQTDLETRVQP